MTSPDLTRRELLEVAAATGGAVVGGQRMPGAISPAAAQGGQAASPPLDVVLRVNGTEQFQIATGKNGKTLYLYRGSRAFRKVEE